MRVFANNGSFRSSYVGDTKFIPEISLEHFEDIIKVGSQQS